MQGLLSAKRPDPSQCPSPSPQIGREGIVALSRISEWKHKTATKFSVSTDTERGPFTQLGVNGKGNRPQGARQAHLRITQRMTLFVRKGDRFPNSAFSTIQGKGSKQTQSHSTVVFSIGNCVVSSGEKKLLSIEEKQI